ncbi:MAG: lipopolysaccharide transport periplasmic protein LptA [Spongiibacteraceae bacterium]
MRNKLIARCWLAGALFFSLAASALPEDSSQPINIQSDRASQKSSADGIQTEYFGNVLMTQGSLKINGDHIVIHSKDQKVTSVLATGSPAMFEQKSDPVKAPIKARANQLDYQLVSDTVILTDNATIVQNTSTVSGKRIEYNIGSEHVKASGGSGDSSQVHMILIPEAKANDSGKQP